MTNEEMKAYAATHPEVRWQFWNTHHDYWQTVRKGGTPQWKPYVKYRLKPGQSSVAQAKAKMAKTRAEIVERKNTGIVADAPWNAVNRAAAEDKAKSIIRPDAWAAMQDGKDKAKQANDMLACALAAFSEAKVLPVEAVAGAIQYLLFDTTWNQREALLKAVRDAVRDGVRS